MEQAADNLLDKASKIDLAQQAVVLRNLAEVAADDVRDVRKLKANRLGGAFSMCGGGDDDVGDIIIGDDVHINQPAPQPPSRAWPVIAGLTLGGALVACGLALPQLLAGRRDDKPSAQPAPAPANNTTVEKRSGFLIDLPDGKRE